MNVTLRDGKGQQFELQFHTKESFSLKTKNHGLYEELRNPNTSETRKNEIIEMQKQDAENITIPEGVESLPQFLKQAIRRGKENSR